MPEINDSISGKAVGSEAAGLTIHDAILYSGLKVEGVTHFFVETKMYIWKKIFAKYYTRKTDYE